MKVQSVRRILCLLCLASATMSAAQAQERIWRVCISDAAVPPLLNNDPANLGLAERVLMEAGREVGLSTILLRYPSARCRALMTTDQIDALVAAPTARNTADFEFPRKAGAVDASRRLARINLVWVKRMDSPYEWQHGALVGGMPSAVLVGTRASLTAASEPLQALGFRVDPVAANTRQMLRKLAGKRIDLGLAIQEEVAAAMQDPALQDLVVLPQSFSSVDFYAAVRQQLSPEMRTKVEAWWSAIAHVRDLPKYRLH